MVVAEIELSQLANIRLMKLVIVVVAVVISTGSFICCTIAALLTSMLKTSSSTDSSTSANNGWVWWGWWWYWQVGQKVVKRSKNHQKVRKTLKVWNVAKVIGSEKRLPKHRSSVNEELKLSSQLSDSFSSSFCWAQKPLSRPLPLQLLTRQS